MHLPFNSPVLIYLWLIEISYSFELFKGIKSVKLLLLKYIFPSSLISSIL